MFIFKKSMAGVVKEETTSCDCGCGAKKRQSVEETSGNPSCTSCSEPNQKISPKAGDNQVNTGTQCSNCNLS